MPALIPNPASVYCTEQGGTPEIRTNPDGSQTGICVFYDGSECEQWDFYYGECLGPDKPSIKPLVVMAGIIIALSKLI